MTAPTAQRGRAGHGPAGVAGDATADRAVVGTGCGTVRPCSVSSADRAAVAQDAVQDVLVRLCSNRSGRTVEPAPGASLRVSDRHGPPSAAHRVRPSCAGSSRAVRALPAGDGPGGCLGRGGSPPGAAAAGALPALSGGPPYKIGSILGITSTRRAAARDAGDRHASTSAGPGGAPDGRRADRARAQARARRRAGVPAGSGHGSGRGDATAPDAPPAQSTDDGRRSRPRGSTFVRGLEPGRHRTTPRRSRSSPRSSPSCWWQLPWLCRDDRWPSPDDDSRSVTCSIGCVPRVRSSCSCR